MTLGHAEERVVRAAEGWLMLGDVASAQAELATLSASLHRAPPVLKVRFGIFSAQRDWASALGVAETLFGIDPTDIDSWVNRSFALHELKRTAEAEKLLVPAQKLFPEEPIVPYNLACYACAQGDLAKARQLLAQAFLIGEADDLKRMAREDPDLAPLRQML